ncbi:murein biosynthesis integral membrane protein MurJ [Dermacoccaceae bacterium W4C1]
MNAAARRTGTGVLAAAGLIAVATLASRIVGFVRWLVFSGSVGSTCVGEIYSTANVVPNVLFEVAAGGALAAVVIPLVGGALARGDRAGADRIASALLTWAMTILVPLAVLLAVLAGPITSALVSDCGSGSSGLAVRMLLVFAPQLPLYALGIVLGGVLQAHRRFAAAALAPLASSLVVVLAYLLYGALANGGGDPARLPVSAEAALTLGTTLGVVALSVPLLVPARRAGIRLRPTWSFPPGTARAAVRLAGAGVIALVAQQLAVLSTVWVSNHRGQTGALNVYTYTQAVYLLPYAVLAVPIATAAFPSLVTAQSAGGDEHTIAAAGAAGAVPQSPGPAEQPVEQVLSRSLRGVLLAGASGAAVLVAVAPAAQAFFTALDAGRGGVGGASLAALSGALTAFAPGLVGFALAALLQRALYARRVTWPVGAAVAAGWLVAAVVPLLVTDDRSGSSAALRALGVASSIGMSLTAVILLVLLARHWGIQVLSAGLRTAVVVLPAAVLAGLLGRFLATSLDGRGLMAATGTGIAAAVLTVLVLGAVTIVADRDSVRALRRRGRS